MRYNRKACLRALQIAAHDATRLPFGLVFSFRNILGEKHNGTRTCVSVPWFADYKEWRATNDDAGSVRFAPVGKKHVHVGAHYQSADTLLPGLKPHSLKKHELRKQARDLRRMKKYG